MHTIASARTLPSLAGLLLALSACTAQAADCGSTPITRHERWTAGSVREISGTYRIPAGTQLTIEPGATARFRNGYISVQGALVVDGTAGAPVTLTSADDVGGVRDAGIARWDGIKVWNEGTVKLSHARILYAGTPDTAPFAGAIEIYDDCGFEMTDSVLMHSQRGGVLFSTSRQGLSPVHRIRDSVISRNAFHGIAIFGDYVHVSGSDITDNGYHGVFQNLLSRYRGRRTKFDANNIVDNGNGGIFLQIEGGLPLAQQPSGHRNNIVGNGDDGDAQIDVYAQYSNLFHPWGVVSDVDGEGDLVDWSGNYFGGPFYEQGCPLAIAVPPLLGPGGAMPPLVHLSPERIPDPCEKPEQGPAAQRTYDEPVPPSVCEKERVYCAVNRIKVTPHADSPFGR